MNLADLEIETERLIIRPYRRDDAPAFKKGIDNSLEILKPWMPWAKYEPEAVEHKLKRIERWADEIQQDKGYTLGIFDKSNQSFIGSSGYHITNEKGILAIGYWIDSRYQGNGFITEASRALTQFAFEKMDAEKIEIRCVEANRKSAAIAKRLNFKLEYTFRTLDKDEKGQRIKEQVWCIFKEEWDYDRKNS